MLFLPLRGWRQEYRPSKARVTVYLVDKKTSEYRTMWSPTEAEATGRTEILTPVLVRTASSIAVDATI